MSVTSDRRARDPLPDDRSSTARDEMHERAARRPGARSPIPSCPRPRRDRRVWISRRRGGIRSLAPSIAIVAEGSPLRCGVIRSVGAGSPSFSGRIRTVSLESRTLCTGIAFLMRAPPSSVLRILLLSRRIRLVCGRILSLSTGLAARCGGFRLLVAGAVSLFVGMLLLCAKLGLLAARSLFSSAGIVAMWRGAQSVASARESLCSRNVSVDGGIATVWARGGLLGCVGLPSPHLTAGVPRRVLAWSG